MKNSLYIKIIPLLLILSLMFFWASTSSVQEVSGTEVDGEIPELLPEVNIPVEGTATGTSTDAAKFETYNCETKCQSCRIGGGYSQITTGVSDLVFQAYTFIYGSDDPYCPCFGEVAGTVTFEYKISDYQTGQQITQGSVTRGFDGGSGGACAGFSYPGGYVSNEFRYPHPGGSVLVELKTTHTVGSTPTQTYVHETSGVY